MLKTLSRGATGLYQTAVALKNFGYDRALKAAAQIPGATVVSIGALRAGGSGKTPLAMHLASELHLRGARPAVVLRGYRGTLEQRGGVVSCGDGPIVGPDEAGDEAHLIARRLPHVPVFVGADRVASARQAVSLGCRVVVLDDGFSHRRISRDVDLLLAAPDDLHPQSALLPHGPLREPARSAGRADVIIGLASDWPSSGNQPEILFDHTPTGLMGADGEPFRGIDQHAPAWLVAGIARPDRFLDTVSRTHRPVRGYSFFRDHQLIADHHWNAIYTRAQEAGAKLLLTTEKDLHRQPIPQGPLPVYALRIETQLVHGHQTWEALIDRIVAR